VCFYIFPLPFGVAWRCAKAQALLSNCSFRHGSVVYASGKHVSSGYNKRATGDPYAANAGSRHAEMDAVSRVQLKVAAQVDCLRRPS